ncbi:ABC transporter ATP-binding protein [Streptomyces sp. NPDC008343]|uniref:ABC transporter ATP-binding protein n=1 Tax=Streptomyces sp. NPDC008343 TaxID=3364828 RepID=UPI0036EC09F9
MTRAITLDNVSKRYGRGSLAVDRLSLCVEPNEFLVLLGPSGCGKSTVLRMIAGLEDITEGDLLLDGVYANDLLPRERDMAMIFQNFALYPNMSSGENIAFPLRLEDPGVDCMPRVEATARLLGIEDVLDRRPHQLSGGERQRVAMGRAISRRPSVFLMDEPLSNLDAKLRTHLRAEIARLTRELGVTTIYVTHDQAEAMSLGDRVAVMRGGVLQQVSTPRAMYALPANVFVAAFIGTPRINLLEAVVYAPLDRRMVIDLGRQRLMLSEPLSPDHQLLRVHQGQRVIVGLRSEAARIAAPSQKQPGEVALSGLVEHMEYQGHEAFVHLTIGARPAVVPELESPRLRSGAQGHKRVSRPRLNRLKDLAVARVAGARKAIATSELVQSPVERPPVRPSELVVRTGPDVQLRPGAHVPVLIDLAHLFAFDHEGRRICPPPTDSSGFGF